jgi:hypothetical protein
MQSGPGFMGGVFFFILWLIMMAVMMGGWVILLVAIWRGMKAHEAIAKTLKNYLIVHKTSMPDTNPQTET